MEATKYIMILNDFGMETPIIFPNIMQHVDVMEMMGLKKSDILSAGFVRVRPLAEEDKISLGSGMIQDIKYTCYGESISIGVKSQPEDSTIVDQMFFGR